MFAQPLDVGHEMQSGVVAQLPQRRRASRSALVEDDDPEMHGIEKAPVRGGGARAGAAVQEQHRRAFRVARLLPVHRVHAVQLQNPRAVGLDLGKELGARRVGNIGHDEGFYNGQLKKFLFPVPFGTARPGTERGAGMTGV